jgi:hypothetical protein
MFHDRCEWTQELNLQNDHIVALFNAIRLDPSFSHQWFSTTALVEIINQVFKLPDFYIALETKQFNCAMTNFPQMLITDNLQMCLEGMICRTAMYSRLGPREFAFCFPHPPKEQRSSRRSTGASSKISSTRSSTRTIQPRNSRIGDLSLPSIPSVQSMHDPPLLTQIRSQRNNVLWKRLEDVLMMRHTDLPVQRRMKSTKKINEMIQDTNHDYVAIVSPDCLGRELMNNKGLSLPSIFVVLFHFYSEVEIVL